ncbi:MAG: phage tail family protein [Solibacillus sp.]
MKSEFNFSLIRENGQVIDMHEKNWWVSRFRIQPPSFNRATEKVDGMHGVIETGVVFDTRSINVMIQLEGYDSIDFDYLRDEIYRTFNPLEEFTIIRDLQPGKRYIVKVANLTGVDYEDGSLEDGYFEVEFVMLQPFAQSVKKSMDLHHYKEWDVGFWQWNMGLDWNVMPKYLFNSGSFVVINIGDIPIDPRQHELEITIKATAASFLQITNHTTGDVYRYNGALGAADTLILRDIRTLKNNVSAFKHTNFQLLTLAVGQNRFSVTGGTIHSIAFNFPFLYM